MLHTDSTIRVLTAKVLSSNLNPKKNPFLGFIAKAHEWTILCSHG